MLSGAAESGRSPLVRARGPRESDMAGNWSLRQLFTKNPRAVLRNAGDPASTETMEVGDFRINTAERTAILRGRDLRLTSDEFDVLVFLTNPSATLCDAAHDVGNQLDQQRPPSDRVLKALLSLRKRLDSVVEVNRYLRTEPWFIYRFDPRSLFAE
jgi:DNA-binding response OmpR family regulator